jgi:hypothetical protein
VSMGMPPAPARLEEDHPGHSVRALTRARPRSPKVMAIDASDPPVKTVFQCIVGCSRGELRNDVKGTVLGKKASTTAAL